MKRNTIILIIAAVSVVVVSVVVYNASKRYGLFHYYKVGEPLDTLDGVVVYYNGNMENNSGQNYSVDHYNIGVKYQCVEFVKRYYYQHYHHKMPDVYGNAKDFFDATLQDGQLNVHRNLIQYTNGSKAKPCKGDIVVYGPNRFNKYGHVAIISMVTEDAVELAQQNRAPFCKPRQTIPLIYTSGTWTIKGIGILGWLHKR